MLQMTNSQAVYAPQRAENVSPEYKTNENSNYLAYEFDVKQLKSVMQFSRDDTISIGCVFSRSVFLSDEKHSKRMYPLYHVRMILGSCNKLFFFLSFCTHFVVSIKHRVFSKTPFLFDINMPLPSLGCDFNVAKYALQLSAPA